MPRFNKWLTDITAGAPVQRVGRKAIRERLAAVVHFLKAAGKDEDREESIHQLRIWTRRSAAALRLFDPLVPKAAGKKMKRRLRKIRRVAGQERDCDVLIDRLRAGQDEPPRTILRALKKERCEARKELDSLRKRKLRHKKLERQFEKFVAQLAWPKRHSSRDSPPFAAWCRSQLVPLGERFFAVASAKLSSDARLHELRIAGKRLRYALELTPAALAAGAHQRLYESLTDLQDRLGTVCDHFSAISRLEEWQASAKSRADRQTLQAQIRHEQRQLAQERKQFVRWWTAARRRCLRADWDAALRDGVGSQLR